MKKEFLPSMFNNSEKLLSQFTHSLSISGYKQDFEINKTSQKIDQKQKRSVLIMNINLKAESLIGEIDKAKKNWDEKSSFTIMGYKNLSESDLDSLRFYARVFLDSGTTNGLAEQYGDMGEILKKCGLQPTSIF